MAYDLQEQEQLEELKAWWKDYGNLVLLGITLAARRRSRDSRAGAITGTASRLRRSRSTSSSSKPSAPAITRRCAISQARSWRDTASTPYGAFAALSAARASFEGGDLAEAKSQLTWVVEQRAPRRDQGHRAAAAGRRAARREELRGGVEARWKRNRMIRWSACTRISRATSCSPRARMRTRATLTSWRWTGARRGVAYRATLQLKLDSLGEATPAVR